MRRVGVLLLPGFGLGSLAGVMDTLQASQGLLEGPTWEALPLSLDGAPVRAAGGAWVAAGAPLEPGEANLLSLRIDRYRRPYEGTDAPREAMQGYLDWEFGLVAQLGRDGSHHFKVLAPA